MDIVDFILFVCAIGTVTVSYFSIFNSISALILLSQSYEVFIQYFLELQCELRVE